MREITAVVHTQDDALRIGRCLETLYPCDEILIVDHGSQDGTRRVAQEYGARIMRAPTGSPEVAPRVASSSWILCLDARESLSESLAASLYEWKTESSPQQRVFSMFLREETAEGWIENPTPQTRLVPAVWDRWHGFFPANDASASCLEGDLLRFVLP
jgi:glycosyltransferase involved in cell wall biosynthesis